MLKKLKTTDFDELSAAQGDWDVHHRPVRTDRFEGHLLLGAIGSIQVDMERWNTALELTGTSPSQSLSFVLPLDDVSAYLSEGFEVTPGRIDAFGPGCEIFAVAKAQTSLISCSISTAALDGRRDSPLAALIAERATGHKVIRSTGPAIDDLRRWWLNLLALSARDAIPTNAHDRLLDETLAITARALSSGEQARGPRPRRRYLLARRARDYMLERRSNPVTIHQVCAYLNISERSLHYTFNALYGESPKRFLKAQRLFAVRQELKSAAGGDRVSDIAMRLGFWDLGYFARDYQAMFGELPSATLRRHCA